MVRQAENRNGYRCLVHEAAYARTSGTASWWCFIADVFYLFIQREISEMRHLISAKFCTVISTGQNFIMPVQNFRGPIPKKFYGPKTGKIRPDFWRLQTSAVNITKTNEVIQNRTSTFCTAIPPTLDEKSLVIFSPLVTKIKRWNCTHPNRLFRETIFRPP